MCDDPTIKMGLEERKLIQSIINQQEDVSFKIRGWAIVLFSGMTYIHIKEPCEFPGSLYFIVVTVILLIFAFLEIRHMTAFFKLVERCGELEKDLKFKIQISLSKKDYPRKRCIFLSKLMCRCKRFKFFRKIKVCLGITNLKPRYLEISLVYIVLGFLSVGVAVFA